MGRPSARHRRRAVKGRPVCYLAGMTTLYDLSAKAIDGSEVKLDQYRGKPLLIVNVASKCGFTPQYDGLEALYEKYASQGFVVLGFPCDQFGHQEPGDEEQIQSFCETKFGVKFPMFAKIDVNGAHTHPVYAFLKSEAPGLLGTKSIKWNFTKFLVDRSGKVVKRFASTDTPEKIEADVRELL
jgi:glutathione peroxidase